MTTRIIPIFTSILVCTVILFTVTPAFAQTYNVYVEPLPEWADYAVNVMYKSTNAWSEANPDLGFYLADDPSSADFVVKWVKEFGAEHVGYAYGNQFIEVGLGDSNCLGSWQPYSEDYISQIMMHEIGHILGLGHTDDINDIMFPIASNTEYGITVQEVTLTNNHAYFAPLCTTRDVTTFSYSVSTDDPEYGFDVYFVPSVQSLEDWSVVDSFSYYSEESCYGENYLIYGDTCENVSGEGGLLVVMGNQLTNPLTTITIQMQETAQSQIFTDVLPSNTESQPLDPVISNPVPQLTMPDWISSAVTWWSNGQITDQEFILIMLFVIKNDIIPVDLELAEYNGMPVPDWIKQDAKRYATGTISDEEFLNSMLYLLKTMLAQDTVRAEDINTADPNFDRSHQHAAILVKIFSDTMEFSNPAFQIKSSWIHFEGRDGTTIHKHATGVSLGYFFETLNIGLDDQCYRFTDGREYCSNEDYKLKFFINREQVSDIREYEIMDDDRILILYGNETYKEVDAYLTELKNQEIIRE